MIVSNGGQLIRVPVDGIRIAGRATQGVTVFNVGAVIRSCRSNGCLNRKMKIPTKGWMALPNPMPVDLNLIHKMNRPAPRKAIDSSSEHSRIK
jgi:hypothetical protein